VDAMNADFKRARFSAAAMPTWHFSCAFHRTRQGISATMKFKQHPLRSGMIIIITVTLLSNLIFARPMHLSSWSPNIDSNTPQKNLRSSQWLQIWKVKGSNTSEQKHVMNGFSQLNKEQWKQMVCTVVQNYSDSTLLSKRRKLIEFGCGAGAFIESAMPCINCSSRDCEVYGIDYSASLISAASSSAFWGNSSNFFVGDLANESLLEKFAGSFDLILSHSVFFYLNDYDHADRVLALMKKSLAPSGQIIISDIPDIEKRPQALEMRRNSSYYTSSQPKAIQHFAGDHLYFSKSFFHWMAWKHSLDILDIVDENDLQLEFYEPAQYRFLVRMAHRGARSHQGKTPNVLI